MSPAVRFTFPASWDRTCLLNWRAQYIFRLKPYDYVTGDRMGKVVDDVVCGHLREFPFEIPLIEKFSQNFTITWGRRREIAGTKISAYFLRPDDDMIDAFGFEREVLLIVSSFTKLQPRVMQAAEVVLSELPARGRVDQGVFFLSSADPDAVNWVKRYRAENPKAPMTISFQTETLITSTSNWSVKNAIGEQQYYNDMFYYKLPLSNDRFFFGRDVDVARIKDSISKSQNVGLFGLRKTGKTSILLKIMRSFSDDVHVFYYDCKLEAIRALGSNELLNRICNDVEKIAGVKYKVRSQMHPTEYVSYLLSQQSKRKRFCFIFDEIEYISPIAILDTHWRKDYIPFWQAIWSAQSTQQRACFIVAGVNPSVVERDVFDGVQNPLFGIINPLYLKGLDKYAVDTMVNYFGGRMGLSFSKGAVDILYKQYGGHPLLTRLACSFIHNEALECQEARPVQITENKFMRSEFERNSDISAYCGHIVTELKQFYPDEYFMLEMLATKNFIEYNELACDWVLTRHLKEYGLVDDGEAGKPVFAIPVVGEYMAAENARRERRPVKRYVVPENRRENWLGRRKKAIKSALDELHDLLIVAGCAKLFDGAAPPEFERFWTCSVVSSEESFLSFINIMNRSFVESVEVFGKKIGIEKYFWNQVKLDVPSYWRVLHKIKCYRHKFDHLQLDAHVEERVVEYMMEDLEGKYPDVIRDGWFTLQLSVLDDMLIALQSDISART